jgi:anti-anti-sigma regulatory factor
MIVNNAKLNVKNTSTHQKRKKITTETEEAYYHNLEFFNILISSYHENRENLYNIKSADELFYEFRKRIFKCQKSSPILVESLERSLKRNELKPNVKIKVNVLKKSSSCPSFTKTYSCINSGCVYRCLFSSIQAHVTQVFKNMDFDFDNKLTYVEFRKGVIGILFGEDRFKVNKINSVTKAKRKESILSSLNPKIRNEFLKCQFDISLFFECPIDENVLFELFLRFDKNSDGIIEFGKFHKI